MPLIGGTGQARVGIGSLSGPGIFLAALLVALLGACTSSPPGADRTVGPPDSLVDGSAAAPAAPAPGVDDERPALDRRSPAASPATITPAPSAVPTGAVPTGAVPAGGPGTTRGQGTRPSQPTGRGFVDTRIENQLPGTPGWKASRSGRVHQIEGYGHATSVTAGEPVRVFVSSSGATFRIQMLRIGWYGGVGARQVWMSEPVKGGLQAGAQQVPTTRMLIAPWRVSATVPTDGLVAGDYVLKLLGSDGASSFVPLIVREARSSGSVLLLNSTLTWLAYNPWGGANSYTARAGGEGDEEGYERRSVVSSFDRPFSRGSGTGGLFDEEYQLVLTAERLGLKLNYAAEADLHGTPEVLDGAYGVALLGHSEYWSRPMRSALTSARDSGANLAFFGANDIYRRIRLQSSPNGPTRQMINYKDGAEDPDKSIDTTADWPKAPHADPESSLVGVQYRCAKARADMVISDPNGWLFRGLGLARGQRLPGLVGEEFDRVVPALHPPRPLQIMAHSPVTCYGYPEYADLTWYSARSGAGVFAAGTLDWNLGLASGDTLTRSVVTTVTERVLQAIAQPMAGDSILAVDNVDLHYNTSGVPLDLNGKPITLPKRR